MSRILLARVAKRSAMRLRTQLGINEVCPVEIFDAATRLGIDVRFLDIPSMEGLYVEGKPPAILVSSLRPAGRQAFTCAHELGHHILKHGQKFDQLIEDRQAREPFEPDEYQADIFAAWVLMPESTVQYGFRARDWDPTACLPDQVYIVACWLGVGYTTLVRHLQRGLELISWRIADELAKKSLRSIRAELLSRECDQNLVVVDAQWGNRSIDCEIGDTILILGNVATADRHLSVEERPHSGTILKALFAGEATLLLTGNGVPLKVRISRRQFTGRYQYKYKEEEPSNVD